MKRIILCSATAIGASICASRASALDIDIGLGAPPRPPVVVQPAPQTTRRWVPDTIVKKEERVLVSGPRHERREERVLVEPARRVKKEERVLIAPEQVVHQPEQILVAPASVVREWVPPVQEQVRIGPVSVTKTVREGFFRDVAVPPVYRTVDREVVVPPKFDIVVREVEIPARYEMRVVEVPAAPRYVTEYREVVIPGHWEEATYLPPPVVIAPARPGIGLGIDIDLSKRRKERD